MQEHKYVYDRNLPHIQPEEATFFITYRLYGSIPVNKIVELKKEYINIKNKPGMLTDKEIRLIHSIYFKKFDSVLDGSLNEPYWLCDDKVATIIADSLHFNNSKEYDLICFSIMPNHVHLVLTTLKNSLPLYAILQKHKRFTAWKSNKILNRTGSFWHPESYDHIVRDEDELKRVIKYTLGNPVKAKFVKHWRNWKWNYLKPELMPEYSL